MLLKKLMKLMFLPSDFSCFVPPSIKYQCWQLQEADSNGSGTLSVEARFIFSIPVTAGDRLLGGNGAFFFSELRICCCWPGRLFSLSRGGT